MFKNIGGKINLFSKILCWVGISLSLIIGFTNIIFPDRVSLLLGIAIPPVGSLLSYVISMFMYGFGELIETNVQIAENTNPEKPKNYWNNKEQS